MTSKEQGLKVKIQHFGSYLSGMVMPNIGAFIAWGLITSLFIPTGWAPNETLAQLVGPSINYLLPLLVGYTGGTLVHGTRGGVVAAVTTMGLIVGSTIPMFLGAMIMAPLSALLIKKFDKAIDGKIPAGFEMLVNNFSAGILAAILAIISLLGVGPIVENLNVIMGSGVDFLIENGMLPLASIFVEPAKVLFLNNAINHGVLGPLALEQVAETGKSLLFLVEANPGPGLGILLAYSVFAKGTAKQTAPGAAIIHFFGGIHEIYFPYILMKPILLLAAIAGGAVGIFTLSLFDAGLVAAASPGSILAVLAMTQKSAYLGVILSVILSCAVSFIVAAFLIKTSKDDTSLEEAKDVVNASKASSKLPSLKTGNVQKIIFACDAGMGSSAMGASILRNMIKEAGLNVTVINSAISKLPSDGEIIITHMDLTNRAKEARPDAKHISVDNFLNKDQYKEIVQNLV